MENSETESSMSYITHKGKRILHIDHTRVIGMPEIEISRAFFEQAAKEIRSQPEGSVRLLTSMSPNLRFNTELAAMEKEFAQGNTPYVSKSAVVGITPIMRAILATLRFVTGRDIRTFDTVEEALDWLAE